MNENFYRIFEKIYKRRKEILLKLSGKSIILPTVDEIIEINKRITQIHRETYEIKDLRILHHIVDSVKNEKEVLKAALILFEKIIKNRPFKEGNKRTAVIVFDMTLENNNVNIEISNEKLYQWAIGLTENRITTDDIIKQINF
ncbi:MULTISPECIES: Fic family protein [Thermodesulfovibrio]|jgi:prophage maintenance system killer protein|uniref:Fic family protein n=1 Tax=Thermodesulfovibrio TaxID=28261 RepID=UPI002636C806|nr:Fic family protein [Thermodesulfovibrio sp.]